MIEILFEQSGDPLRAAALKDSEDVLCLPFLLDTGALQGGIGSPDRAAVLAMSLGQNGQSSDPKADLLAPLLTELKRLETYLGQGASVRIWYSDTPYSLCGLYHLCSILLKWGNAVYTVKMPEYLSAPRFITRYQNLGEVPPDVFSTFLTAEKKLSRLEIQMYAMHWENLKKDNSPLRAVVNGRVIGVPESVTVQPC